jgi:hypothetical protein
MQQKRVTNHSHFILPLEKLLTIKRFFRGGDLLGQLGEGRAGGKKGNGKFFGYKGFKK